MLKNSMPGTLSGWVDLSIGELLGTHPEFLSAYAYVLITALDSANDTSSTRIGRDIMQRYPSCKDLDGTLLVPGQLVSELRRNLDLFVGFDAIWCFDAMPDKAKPLHVSIAPPPSFDVEEPTAAVQEWMNAMRCGLALADGFGMNYVTQDARIAAFLLSL